MVGKRFVENWHSRRNGMDKALQGSRRHAVRTCALEPGRETILQSRCANVSPAGIGVGNVQPENPGRAPLERLMHAIRTLTGAQAVTLRIRQEDDGSLELAAACGLSADQEERMAIVQGRCGVCCDAIREPAVLAKRESCGCVRTIAAADRRPLRVFAVPVSSRQETSGVLSVFLDDGKTSGEAEPSGMQEMLLAIGAVVGVALESAPLSEADFHAALMLQRHLIANEVHDSLAQNLSSIRMRTALLRDAVGKGDTLRTANYLSEIDESLASAQQRVREIITDFRTQMGAAHLVPALEQAIDELRAASGVPIEFQSRVGEPGLSAYEQIQVFYIAREAVTNALKHSRGTIVRVALIERDQHLELQVEDDGIGIDCSKRSDAGHFGLNIMRERAARLGGQVSFSPVRTGGTRVTLRLPSVREGVEVRQ